MNHWRIICTAKRKEFQVYAAILALGWEAWLPREPRFSRVGRHSQRQWWGPILPSRIFACVPANAHPQVLAIDHCKGMARDIDGFISVPEKQIVKFREDIERENREFIRLHGVKRQPSMRPGAIRKPRPSAKLKVRGEKANNLRKWEAALHMRKPNIAA